MAGVLLRVGRAFGKRMPTQTVLAVPSTWALTPQISTLQTQKVHKNTGVKFNKIDTFLLILCGQISNKNPFRKREGKHRYCFLLNALIHLITQSIFTN